MPGGALGRPHPSGSPQLYLTWCPPDQGSHDLLSALRGQSGLPGPGVHRLASVALPLSCAWGLAGTQGCLGGSKSCVRWGCSRSKTLSFQLLRWTPPQAPQGFSLCTQCLSPQGLFWEGVCAHQAQEQCEEAQGGVGCRLGSSRRFRMLQLWAFSAASEKLAVVL